MKGYHFFVEFPDKKSKNKATRRNLVGHEGNVIAVILKDNGYPESYISQGQIIHEAICSVLSSPNSPVTYACVGWEYLRERCKRISEKQAREIHSELFRYLDD